MATERQKEAARQNIEKAREVQSERAHGENIPRETEGLSTAEKDRLGDSEFAFPRERKEPLTDARHVRNAIAQTGISGSQQAIAYLVFAVIGTLGVGIPVVLYFAMGDRSAKLLGQLKDWMSEHNAVIMTVLCLIIGVKLIGDAISGLTS